VKTEPKTPGDFGIGIGIGIGIEKWPGKNADSDSDADTDPERRMLRMSRFFMRHPVRHSA